MFLTNHLSRGDIVARTGLPNDVVTFWVRQGVLVPVEQPTGNRKWLRFPYYEANIAAITNEVRNFGANISSLVALSDMLRSSVLWANEQGFSDKIDFWNVSDYKSLLRKGEVSQERVDEIAKLNRRDMHERHINAACNVDYEEFNQLDAAYSVATDQPERIYEHDPTFFWRDGSSWKLAGAAPKTTEAHSCIAISVSAVLFQVWNEPAKGKTGP